MAADGSDVQRLTTAGGLSPSWSADASKIAFQSTRDGNLELYVMDADGSNQTRLTSNTAAEEDPSFSPDGSRIAFSSDRDGNTEIYVMDGDGANPTRLTTSSGVDRDPVFSPDGTKIAFSSSRDDGFGEIYVMNADGTGQTRLTTRTTGYDAEPDWSPDGTKIVFSAFAPSVTTSSAIFTMNADGTNVQQLIDTAGGDTGPVYSPDGTKVAFASSAYNDNDVLTVSSTDGSNLTNLTNVGLIDYYPDWAPATAPAGEHTLSVSTSGAGSGSVSSSPSGIDCGSTCSADYSDGTQVTLSAIADPGSSFDGWSGDCTGTDTCLLTMSHALSVTASFSTTGGGGGDEQISLTPPDGFSKSGTVPVTVDGTGFLPGSTVRIDQLSSAGGVHVSAARAVGIVVSPAGAFSVEVELTYALPSGQFCDHNPTDPSGARTCTLVVSYTSGGSGIAVETPLEFGDPSTNDPPTVDAGGPYSGNEDAAIALDGTVSDPDGDSLMTAWSYAPLSGVAAGATCSFGNASAVDTTITCTDDGSYTVTLTADDGQAAPVSDSATVVVSDVTVVVPGSGDEFGGTSLDPAVWDGAAVRWTGSWTGPYTVPTPTVTGGEAIFAHGSSRVFHYVWSKDGLIPATGDFVFEARVRYDARSPHGDGMHVRPWADPTPVGTNSPYAAGAERCAMLNFWSDSANPVIVGMLGLHTTTTAGVYHVLRWEYVNGKYFLFVDGDLRIGPISSNQRPDRVWLGNPLRTGITAEWTDFRLDYLRVTQPGLIDGDGNGQSDGTQDWGDGAGLTAAARTDSDDDGMPDLCDPAPSQPVEPDVDGDGTPDSQDVDDDNDGLWDIVEIWLDCDPHDSDTDDDGISDGMEVIFKTSPTLSDSNPDDGFADDGAYIRQLVVNACSCVPAAPDVDSDGGGAGDWIELYIGTDPNSPTDGTGAGYSSELEYIWHLCGCGPDDPDGNGVPAAIEHYFDEGGFLEIIHACGCMPWEGDDPDGDGLSVIFEVSIGTDPYQPEPDSDGDGLVDIIELYLGCDPDDSDTDGDGLTDRDEIVVHKTLPTKADTDGDGLDDKREIELGCDPNNPDTDGDAVPDGADPAPRAWVKSCVPTGADPVAVGAVVKIGVAQEGDVAAAAVAWGDGAISAGGTSASYTATHGYTAAGVYTVECSVTDPTGGTQTTSYQYIVVFDSSGGFVTGGGWINSPAGAFATDPSMTGKANFGFVSKYKKGANVPTGATEFQFQAGGLDFHSDEYQWLVVSGPKAQFKGSGTLNGEAGYSFKLTAVDGGQKGGGGVDKFRIKIWNTATEAIVYDNMMSPTDDLGQAQALGAGSIVIHEK